MADSIDRILGFLQEHNLDLNAPLPARFHYGESALICLDTVLSIGRDHGDFVEPRMNHFLQHWPRVRSLPTSDGSLSERGLGASLRCGTIGIQRVRRLLSGWWIGF